MDQNTTTPSSSDHPANGIDQDRGVAVAARFPLLFWLPLISSQKTALGTFHANQGLVHLITWFVGNFVLAFIPILGWALIPLWLIANVVFMILGMVDASKGGQKPLPVVGGITLIK